MATVVYDGQPPGVKGTIEMVGNMYRVTFFHFGIGLKLGLFGTLDESRRVCDILNIKVAVDARRDLESLPLHYDLARYGIDSTTAGEVRSMPFGLVVRDLQVCAVQSHAQLYSRQSLLPSAQWAVGSHSSRPPAQARGQLAEVGKLSSSVPASKIREQEE